MSRISFEVPLETKAELEMKAESLGMSLAGYARKLVLDGSRRDSRSQQDCDRTGVGVTERINGEGLTVRRTGNRRVGLPISGERSHGASGNDARDVNRFGEDNGQACARLDVDGVVCRCHGNH